MLTNKYIHEIIGECVASLRAISEIVSVTDNLDGTLTLSAVNSLNENEIVTIEDTDYRVFNVSNTQFDITGLIENIGDSFTYKKPYFLHEKRIKANEILAQYEQGAQSKFEKYPLVLLIRPYTEDYSNPDYVLVSDIKIAIVNYTKQEWNANQRYENNIVENLEPIYQGLLNAFTEHDDILVYDKRMIEHSREDECLIDGNPLPDTLDGILLTFKLKIRKSCNPDEITQQFNLSIFSASQGTTDPEPGNYIETKGTSKTITATGNLGYVFEKWLLDGVEQISNPISILYTKSKQLVALFKEGY